MYSRVVDMLAGCVVGLLCDLLWSGPDKDVQGWGEMAASLYSRVVDVLAGCVVGLLCDLLWSDPDKDVQGWGENDRGVSFTFGADVVSKFLNRHDLDLICRAHQVSTRSAGQPRAALRSINRTLQQDRPYRTDSGTDAYSPSTQERSEWHQFEILSTVTRYV